MIVPVVAGSHSESRAHTVLATGVGSFMFHPIGARWSQPSSSSCIWAPASSPSAPTTALMASVRIGPAATRFDRTPYLPASRATNRLTDSSALLATVIQLYAGIARVGSKSMPTMAPPRFMIGSNALASDAYEYAEMWMPLAMSSYGASKNGSNPMPLGGM